MNLKDTFYLPRAGRYANAKTAATCLPLVYGDLTDGSEGIWALPCIDTANFVYCYAGFPVLSTASGNAVSIYADGEAVDPAGYAFSESIDYEGKGPIATVTFSSDQGNKAISARGKGKGEAGILIENVVEIVDDVLVNLNGFVAADLYEATRKSTAAQVFEAQGYKAAGVIQADAVLWDLIRAMMGSFLGSAYLNGAGRLVLEFDTGNIAA